jgi:hypothetical protein
MRANPPPLFFFLSAPSASSAVNPILHTPIPSPMPTRTRAKSLQVASGLSLALFAIFASGCYERTVHAKGIGAMGTKVQEGYRSDTAADRAWDSMFSDPRESKPVPKNPGVGTVR